MLTPDTLRDMTPEQRTQLFESLSTAYYGTTRNAEKIAADFDVSRPTIFRWRRENLTPWAVLFTLDRWLHGDGRARQIMGAWGEIPAQLSDAAAAMSKVAANLDRIARHLPVVLDDGPAS